MDTQNQNLENVKYSDKYRKQVLDVWEKSVLATHDFLKPSDFHAIKEIVKTIDFNAFDVYCLMQNDEPGWLFRRGSAKSGNAFLVS